MSYIALHYVKVKGRMYMPGEIIDEELSGDVAERMLGKGAIREEAPSNASARDDDAREEPRMTTVTKKQAAKPAVVEEEADDTMLIPEINAMDGIVGGRKKTRGKRS